MTRTKRRTISPDPGPSRNRKRSRLALAADPIIVEDEDDMDVILARIKEQQDSEKLARLQEEQGLGVAGPGVAPQSVSSDEALARKLAREWGHEVIEIDSDSDGVINIDDAVGDEHISAPNMRELITEEGNDISPDQHLEQFRSIFTAVQPCRKCSKAIAAPRGFVVFKNLTGPMPASLELRAIALFEALGGFDRLYLGERASSESRAQANLEKRKQKSKSDNGVGYGKGSSGGSYRGGRTGNAGSSRRKRLDDHWDDTLVAAFTTISSLLPSPCAENASVYDMLPHPSIGSLLLVSHLPGLLVTLLRNDSVTDWIAREPLYQSMLDLLRRLSDHELTVSVLTGKRWVIKDSKGLEAWMWDETEIEWEDAGSDENTASGPPIYHHFQRLTKQSQAFLSGASQSLETAEEPDETMIKGLSLCGEIIAANDTIERACTILENIANKHSNSTSARSDKGKGRAPAPRNLEAQYSQACEKTAFRYVLLHDDNGQYRDFNFIREIQTTQNSTRNPKDRLHLIKELAVMATSLPPGIWVRVDEVRNDVIKVMIAGPQGTPYAGGLFEFDCFIPLQYPNGPPIMHFRTTGGGFVRFNPNLYEGGKVCLSLLGTWQGRPEEQWTSKSTLLQVFVSIQGMIFVELPYFNEPGYGAPNPKSSASIQYNQRIILETTRLGIVDWLSDGMRSSIWADVIKSHFTIWKDTIREQITQWAKLNPSIRHNNGRDLLADYDSGIQRIQRWNIG
ncbi:hypothetical protein AX16_000460 [Volvariella volvacea WC 439]|nr:hypothetical protein AX16_000460 [Volvariella volvacea WC 439]